MLNLIAAASFFVLIHLLISGTPVRDAVIARIGERPYLGGFVVASWMGIIWLGWAFATSRGDALNTVVWDMTPATHWAQLGIQLLATLFIVPGLTTRSPTLVRGEAALDDPDIVRGMLRVTRHPFLWGVAIWAAGHLLVNGDVASVVLFAAMLFLAVSGTTSIDAKRRRALGAKWDAFAGRTSNVPFAAIVQGRQHLSLGEIGWWRIALAVAVWAIFLVAHPYLFGVPALP
ncbi:MAG: NnrU family protein [Phenylobacterium sp.]